jgi:serine/threonine-protein kinase RsbT
MIAGGAGQASVRVLIRDESDIVMARKRTRELALGGGLPERATEALVTAVSEIARNALVHGGGGDLLLAVVEEGGRRAVQAMVRDEGPGLSDPEQAMRDGYSTAGGLGLGLSSARRLVSEFKLSTGRGTIVVLKQWIEPTKNASPKD